MTIDITGHVFGRLTALRIGDPYTTPQGKKLRRWICKCECGNESLKKQAQLRSGKIKSCGCDNPPRYDLAGKRFGRYTVIDEVYSVRTCSGIKLRAWNCVCDCGNKSVVRGSILRSGSVKSCGCYNEDTRKVRNITHGMTDTRTYSVWQGMISRISYKSCPNYHRYGGRGITCDPKYRTFEGFYSDFGELDPLLQMDRRDNDKGYFKGNIRFVTRKENNRNKSTNVPVMQISLDGKEVYVHKTIVEASESTGIDKNGISGASKGRYKSSGGYKWLRMSKNSIAFKNNNNNR